MDEDEPIDVSSALLCKVTQVQSAKRADFSTGRGWHFKVIDQVPLDEAETIALLQQLRDLPDGLTARCHVPSYAVRILRDAEPVGAISTCWECNNAFGEIDGVDQSRHFDGESPEAQRMLDEVRRRLEAGPDGAMSTS